MKKYIRNCDYCKKEIKELYDYGVTTLYKNIRIGRGMSFNDYRDGSILNKMKEEQPDDWDNYGKGFNSNDDKEFNFCSPECLFKFISKLYEDTYKETINKIKKQKNEGFDKSFDLFKKKHDSKIPFFKKIQNKFSKDYFKKDALEEADILIKIIKGHKKYLEEK